LEHETNDIGGKDQFYDPFCMNARAFWYVGPNTEERSMLKVIKEMSERRNWLNTKRKPASKNDLK
jgi:hypothetical protein